MKVAFINSNVVKIGKNAKKGSEIFDYVLINGMKKKKQTLRVTAFASGNSSLPAKIESVNYYSSSEDKYVGMEHHKIFEIALLSKAISMQKNFDLLHLSIGNGELILPFVKLLRRPVVVTMHGSLHEKYVQKYFSLFKDFKNLYFVSITNSQRKPLPNLNYVRTIYHGVDSKRNFIFNPTGGNCVIWTGRAVPEKGLDTVLTVIKHTKKPGRIFPIIKEEYFEWLKNIIIRRRNLMNQAVKIYIDFDVHRMELIHHYQASKLFLFPLEWEEPFGLTIVEAMACGTPVVAYARGSIPELIKDGETGLIVNPSDDDIRGNFIIKKTGIEGLCEAVEHIYSLPEPKYQAMRLACRQHVETNFTVERMVDEYEKVYQEVLKKRPR
ncbi:glycosyltransferase [Patescibacteria group bacterium]|nr:glycosyltransferase [Patescibacteria group bacterium]MCL5092012.1 glycosyltransferase [Patescibacteria group bacterium]